MNRMYPIVLCSLLPVFAGCGSKEEAQKSPEELQQLQEKSQKKVDQQEKALRNRAPKDNN